MVGWCQAQKMGDTIENHWLVGWLVQSSKLWSTIEIYRLVGWLGHITLRSRMVKYRLVSFGPNDLLNYRYIVLLTY